MKSSIKTLAEKESASQREASSDRTRGEDTGFDGQLRRAQFDTGSLAASQRDDIVQCAAAAHAAGSAPLKNGAQDGRD